MLFNSSFSSVQRGGFRNQALEGNKGGSARRDAIFYPWITPAVCFTNCDKEFRVPAVAADFEVKYDELIGEVYIKNRKRF